MPANRVRRTAASTGAVQLQYRYGPFGELIRATGPMAKLNPFRFSTKYQDDETDLVYYGYRYYNASTGRWLSRDPIGERGGLNLNGMVNNSPVNYIDAFGLSIRLIPVPPIFPPIPTIPIPIPDPVPAPYLGPDDVVPTDFTGLALCQRPFKEENIIDKCLNRCGQGHKFLAGFENGNPTEGYGFYQNGKVNSEKLLTCPRGKACKPTNGTLRYGSGQGTTGKAASKEQILECIKNHPPLGSYNAPFNDCRHFASQAASDCGLDCGQ